MRELDRILDDEPLVTLAYEALSKRHSRSRTRGRPGTSADVVLRLLAIKPIFNWSFADVEREVKGSLLYRQWAHVGAGAAPNRKTLGRQALALGPEVLGQMHRRLVAIAREHKIASGRRMRVDNHGGGEQHPLPHRQQSVGRWRPRPDPRDEEGERNCRWCGNPTARPPLFSRNRLPSRI
jgi:hypothetical protein